METWSSDCVQSATAHRLHRDAHVLCRDRRVPVPPGQQTQAFHPEKVLRWKSHWNSQLSTPAIVGLIWGGGPLLPSVYATVP